MKKIIKIASLIIMAVMLAGCSQGAGGDKTTNETFNKTTVYNPNTTKVKLLGVSKARSVENDDEVCEVEPLQTKEVELGNEHEYYFTDAEGNKIADLSKSDSGQYLPVYLELNEPKDGKKYLLLNQYKTDAILESFTRYSENGETYETYGLLLYEIVNADDIDSYKYDANTYIRIYPSANYWIDSKGYATNKIGTEITYDENFRKNFEPLSNSWVAWGWSTKNVELNMWFCHRVVSYILHAIDGDSYEVKSNVGEQASISTMIQAVYSENPNWTEKWSLGLPDCETTKWKVTEIWFYSTQKLYYDSKFNSNKNYLESKLQEIIPGCRLYLIQIDSESYDGWMPQNCKYALCMRLESKNCYVQNVWCEDVKTNLLKDAYKTMKTNAKNFIINY